MNIFSVYIQVIENGGQPLTIAKTGTATVQMQIANLSMHYENRKFVLHASCEGGDGSYITPAVSEPMLAIRYRLTIEEHNIRGTWYKDEGGKDKCIDLHLGLRDSNNELIVARKVPLRVSLLYESGMKVLRQEILKINPDNKLLIDETGKALLRLRIEDVSKNHQKQSFIIQVSPDTGKHPLNSDISPAASIPIEVRSKINASTRQKRTRDLAMSNSHALLPPSSTQRTDVKSSASSVLPSSLSLPANSTTIPGNAALSPSSAVTAMIDWMYTAIESMLVMKWRQYGNERQPDGSTRPLYEMTNPNSVIDELVQRFNDAAVPSANYLYHALHVPETSVSTTSVAAGASAPSTGNRPQIANNQKNVTNGPQRSISGGLSRERSDSESFRTGSALLLNLSMSARDRESSNMATGDESAGGYYNLSIPPRDRDVSSVSIPSMNRATTADIFETLSYSLGPPTPQEGRGTNTHYIVVKRFNSRNLTMPIGCPAFDINRRIIGYIAAQCEQNMFNKQETTSPKFCGLDEMPCRLMSTEELKVANEIAECSIRAGEDCVYCRDNYDSYEAMVEEALIRLYMGNIEDINLWEQ